MHFVRPRVLFVWKEESFFIYFSCFSRTVTPGIHPGVFDFFLICFGGPIHFFRNSHTLDSPRSFLFFVFLDLFWWSNTFLSGTVTFFSGDSGLTCEFGFASGRFIIINVQQFYLLIKKYVLSQMNANGSSGSYGSCSQRAHTDGCAGGSKHSPSAR